MKKRPEPIDPAFVWSALGKGLRLVLFFFLVGSLALGNDLDFLGFLGEERLFLFLFFLFLAEVFEAGDGRLGVGEDGHALWRRQIADVNGLVRRFDTADIDF